MTTCIKCVTWPGINPTAAMEITDAVASRKTRDVTRRMRLSLKRQRCLF